MTSAGAWALVGVAVAGLIAGIAGGAIVLWATRRGKTRSDIPDDRRLHGTAIGRGGGIGIIVAGAFALPLAQWWSHGGHAGYMISVLILAWATPNAFIGLTDDYYPLGAKLKLGLQVSAATMAVALGLRISTLHIAPLPAVDVGVLGWPLSILWLVWLTNMFNFMDGIDGIATTCGALFFSSLAAVAIAGGCGGLPIIAVAVAGACAGFLALNRPPARIFMGDGASLFLGALLGGLSLQLSHRELAALPLSVPLIILAPFLFDTTYTLMRRIARGESILAAHRQHLYQRLVSSGWSVWRVLGLYALATLTTGFLAVCFGRFSGLGQVGVWLALGSLGVGLVAVTRAAERSA